MGKQYLRKNHGGRDCTFNQSTYLPSSSAKGYTAVAHFPTMSLFPADLSSFLLGPGLW